MLLKDFNAWQCMNKRNPKLRSDIYFKLAHYIYVSSTDGLIVTIQALSIKICRRKVILNLQNDI